jgi:hypothetical protein
VADGNQGTVAASSSSGSSSSSSDGKAMGAVELLSVHLTHHDMQVIAIACALKCACACKCARCFTGKSINSNRTAPLLATQRLEL